MCHTCLLCILRWSFALACANCSVANSSFSFPLFRVGARVIISCAASSFAFVAFSLRFCGWQVPIVLFCCVQARQEELQKKVVAEVAFEIAQISLNISDDRDRGVFLCGLLCFCLSLLLSLLHPCECLVCFRVTFTPFFARFRRFIRCKTSLVSVSLKIRNGVCADHIGHLHARVPRLPPPIRLRSSRGHHQGSHAGLALCCNCSWVAYAFLLLCVVSVSNFDSFVQTAGTEFLYLLRTKHFSDDKHAPALALTPAQTTAQPRTPQQLSPSSRSVHVSLQQTHHLSSLYVGCNNALFLRFPELHVQWNPFTISSLINLFGFAAADDAPTTQTPTQAATSTTAAVQPRTEAQTAKADSPAAALDESRFDSAFVGMRL